MGGDGALQLPGWLRTGKLSGRVGQRVARRHEWAPLLEGRRGAGSVVGPPVRRFVALRASKEVEHFPALARSVQDSRADTEPRNAEMVTNLAAKVLSLRFVALRAVW